VDKETFRQALESAINHLHSLSMSPQRPQSEAVS
jgi:hypothetical protein